LPSTKAEFIPFTAQTRMSGINFEGRQIAKGATGSVKAACNRFGRCVSAKSGGHLGQYFRAGGTPLVVSQDARVMGVIHLKDIVKGACASVLRRCRVMGIRTV